MTRPSSRLSELIVRAGLAEPMVEALRPEVVAEAAPERSTPASPEMRHVYDIVNETLLDRLRRRSMRIVHVTGEGRVLVDPNARKVIKQNAKDGVAAEVTIHGQGRHMVDAFSMQGALHDHWHKVTLVDLYEIYELVARGELIVSVTPDDPPVHYSVFGNDFVLIQEQQTDDTERKRIWFLRCEPLASELSLRALEITRSAYRLPPASFRNASRFIQRPDINALLEGRLGSSLPDTITSDDIARLEGMGLYRAIGDGPQAGREVRISATFPSASLISEAASRAAAPANVGRVLLLAEHKAGQQGYGDVAAAVMSAKGIDVEIADGYLLEADQIAAALSFERIVSIVSSVGTASETLTLLHHNEVRRRVPSPEFRIFVPAEYVGCHFSRAVEATFSGAVEVLPSSPSRRAECEAVFTALADQWMESRGLVEASAGISDVQEGMDEGSRRAAITAGRPPASRVKTWDPTSRWPLGAN